MTLVLPEAKRLATPGDIPGVSFLQARNYTSGQRLLIKWIVIHTAETGETPNAAEALMKWCAGPDAPKASWHYAVDADSITQSVLERDIAWHAPGANRYGIGIEHAGRSAQKEAGWKDDYSCSMLARSSKLVAALCSKWAIPLIRIGSDELLAGAKGICGHVDVSRAFGKSTHWDPGPSFPWSEYLEAVQRFAPS